MNHPSLPSGVPKRTSPFWWFRWVPTAVITAIILYLLYVVGSVVLIPVLASFALAYLLNPVVYQFEKRGISRTLSALAAIVLVSLGIAAFLAYVVPDLWAEGSRAGQAIAEKFTPENAARQRAWLKRYSPALERVAGDKIELFLSDPVAFYNENITTPTTTIDPEGNVTRTNGSTRLVSTIASSLDMVLVPFFVFYILIDFPRWRDSIEELIPPRFREPFSRMFDESGRILESYVRGQLVIALIMAVCYAIGFWFLGVPAWAGIAMIAGLLNMVPYFGTVFGFALAASFTLAEGGGIWEITGVLGVFVAVQTLEGYVLTPKILGGRLNLHPMAVFLGLLVGGKLFGIMGIILSIPTIAIGKVFFKFAAELYRTSQFYRYGTEDIPSTPPDRVEEKIADAADTVLAEQQNKDEDQAQTHESPEPAL